MIADRESFEIVSKVASATASDANLPRFLFWFMLILSVPAVPLRT
jgi:hypothetical protein